MSPDPNAPRSASSAPTVAALRALFPALADAAPSTLARIVLHGIHRKATAGSVVFDARTPCAGFPLVLAGTLKVLQRYPNGRELQLYRVKPGESCLLSGSCLLGHADYTASGVAESDLELGSVREIVSRLLRAFEDKGWVDLARERIRITDRNALAALAKA